MKKRGNSITKFIISTSLVSSAVLGVTNITAPTEVSAKKADSFTYVSTKINGNKVNVKAKSIKKDGVYFVHSTEVLNKLGVKSSFNSTTKILTVKNGSKYAYEGKKKYKLSSTLQSINGKMYVPSDFISKATNYQVKTASNTLSITEKKTGSTKVDHKNIPSVSKRIFNINAPNKTLGNSYGEKDVASYNKLVKHLNPFAEEAIAYAKAVYGDDSKEMKAFDDFYNKGVSYNYDELSRDEKVDPYIESIIAVDDIVGVLKKEGVSSKTAEKVYRDYLTLGYFVRNVLNNSTDNYYDVGKINNNNDSLYDYLHGKGGNCRTDAQLLMFMHNKLGNETIALANAKFTHVSVVYKVKGEWIRTNAGNIMALHDFTGTEIYNIDAHY